MTAVEFTDDDVSWMRQALKLAQHAASLEEVPVGAVLVRNGILLGEGWNAPISVATPVITPKSQQFGMPIVRLIIIGYRLHTLCHP